MARPPSKNPRGVFERPKGSGIWWVLYYDQNGQRRREKVGPKSLAIETYYKRKVQIREGKFFPDQVGRQPRHTLAAALDAYCEARAHRPHHSHRLRYARYWKETFKNAILDQIKPGDIEKYRQTRLKTVKPATTNREVAFLKAVYNMAIRDEKTEKNPCARVKMLQENNCRIRFLTDEEEPELEAAMDAEDYLLVEFAFHTGLRQSEQFNLAWNNVDLVNEFLTVPQSKHGEKRYVQLNERALEILRSLSSRLKSPWVFLQETARLRWILRTSTIGSSFRRWRRPASRTSYGTPCGIPSSAVS